MSSEIASIVASKIASNIASKIASLARVFTRRDASPDGWTSRPSTRRFTSSPRSRRTLRTSRAKDRRRPFASRRRWTRAALKPPTPTPSPRGDETPPRVSRRALVRTTEGRRRATTRFSRARSRVSVRGLLVKSAGPRAVAVATSPDVNASRSFANQVAARTRHVVTWRATPGDARGTVSFDNILESSRRFVSALPRSTRPFTSASVVADVAAAVASAADAHRPPRRRRSRWRRRVVRSGAVRPSPRPTRPAAWTRPRAPGRYTRWRERSRRKFRTNTVRDDAANFSGGIEGEGIQGESRSASGDRRRRASTRRPKSPPPKPPPRKHLFRNTHLRSASIRRVSRRRDGDVPRDHPSPRSRERRVDGTARRPTRRRRRSRRRRRRRRERRPPRRRAVAKRPFREDAPRPRRRRRRG